MTDFSELIPLANRLGVKLSTAFKIYRYLRRFYLLTKDEPVEDFITALKDTKRILGLEETDIIDEDFLELIKNTYRCGCPKILGFTETELHYKWLNNDLTYAVRSYLTRVPQKEQDEVFQESFDAWSRHANVKVTRTKNTRTADIVVERKNLDGPGNVLGQAGLPQGKNHTRQLPLQLDDADFGTGRISLLAVMTHEVGHNLGLDHSDQRSALMFPTYNPRITTPQQVDDVPRIIKRYGKVETPKEPENPTFFPGTESEIG